MIRGVRPLFVVTTLLAASAWVAALGQSATTLAPATRPAPARPQPGPQGAIATPGPSPDYVGSAACERCHTEAYARWKASLHIQMTRPVAEARILGDFSREARFSAHGRTYEFGTKNGRPTVTVRAEGRAAETHTVDYTLGSKRFQGYLSTLPDGRIYVLPVFWQVEGRRWLDWKETTPIPDGAHDMKQIWNVNCFNCHATNLDRGYVPATRGYRTAWTELGIGCEACHGPGRTHVALMASWEKDPSSIPTYSSRADNRQLSDTLKTFSPRTAVARRTFDTCGYCHGNKRNVFTGFAAGDRYEDHALPFLLSEPLPEFDAQGEFWPDGRPNRFNRTQALSLSGCFKAGAITCTNCHVAHAATTHEFSLKVDITTGRGGDGLCTQCHRGPADATASAAPQSPLVRVTSRAPEAIESRVPWSDQELSRHSFHAADSPGSRCINCHMSDVNWRLLIRRRDHTFQSPVPETTAAFGVPNACTTCHDDRTPEWAARQMDVWWGDTARRTKSVTLARTMYAAGAGDTSVVPALVSLAVDRTQGAVIRASAVDYIGRLAGVTLVETAAAESQTATARPQRRAAATAATADTVVTPRVFGALLGVAADPEPLVRAQAVRTLGALGRRDERAIAVLMARVVDETRVVRAYAAEALLALDVVTAPGPAGDALSRAQADLDARLRAFPESASGMASLAWLHALKGDDAEATRAVDAALALDATQARPHVIRGVLAARAGKLADAIAAWKKARSLDAATPNIDTMIDEATKRLAVAPRP